MPTSKPKNRIAKMPSCSILDTYLIERVEHPERAKKIDAKIRKIFEKKVAILVLDMSGFSRLVQRYGIIHYLAMIRRMRRVVAPAVLRHGGAVIKFEADNCFAVYPKADQALDSAIDILHDIQVANYATPDESDIHVSMGIGFGPTLLACDDLYGNEMNLASKLGEDVAEKNEILITESAKMACKHVHEFKKLPLTISGVSMNMYRLQK